MLICVVMSRPLRAGEVQLIVIVRLPPEAFAVGFPMGPYGATLFEVFEAPLANCEPSTVDTARTRTE